MKVNGIIAEYNPFHNGHSYHLNTAEEQNNADYTIIAMSGNFMQRGEPALIDKYKRAEMALRNGADLVLELPAYYSASSAEYFAIGAVTLLDKLGVVDYLCFGSECGEINILTRIAEIIATEPEKYTNTLRHYMREGLSFPTARTTALLEYDPSLSNYHDVLSSPNNILGMEYIKALILRKSSMQPQQRVESVPITTITDWAYIKVLQRQYGKLSITDRISPVCGNRCPKVLIKSWRILCAGTVLY